MLDTNSFDYLFRRQLQNQMISASNTGKIKFYITDVQLDELNAFKIKDPTKYQFCQDIIAQVPIEEVSVYGIYFGGGPSKRGYAGPKWGHATFGDGDPIFDQARDKFTTSHPNGERADLSIIETAFHEKMDYIVTDNKQPFKNMIERLQKERSSTLQLITNAELGILLRHHS